MKKSKKVGIIIGCVAFLIIGVFIISNDKTKSVDKTVDKTEENPVENPVDNVVSSNVESSGEKLNVTIGSGEGSMDEEITIPITFDEASKAGVDACDFKISYDPNVLEATGATYGEVLVSGNESFTAEIDNSTGVISYLFMDNTLGKQPIVQKGIFSNITFKVKKDAVKGSTPVSLKLIGAFVDGELREHEVTFKEGSVNVK